MRVNVHLIERTVILAAHMMLTGIHGTVNIRILSVVHSDSPFGAAVSAVQYDDNPIPHDYAFYYKIYESARISHYNPKKIKLHCINAK